jgi:transcriptional regulator with XRE-family HTH domain
MTAAQLQKALDRAGMSQRGTAKELGISERQMRRYCSGEAKVPKLVEIVMRLRAALQEIATNPMPTIGELRKTAREALGSAAQREVKP